MRRTPLRRLLSVFSNPAQFFLITGLLVGMALCVVIPFNAGFDEETHLARLYDISGLNFIPNQSGSNGTAPAPAEFFQLSYQRRYFQTPAFDLFKPGLFLKKINSSPDNMYAIETRSTYPPLNFLPQAVVAGLGWRVFNLPVLPVTIACRMVGLWVVVLGVYAAIRLLPLGKWVLALLALSPMALFTAATINIDGFSTMTAFLFIALVLNLAAAAPAPLGARQTLTLLAVAMAMAMARPNSFLLLPLLLALSFRRFQPRRWFFILWGGAALVVVLALGWNVVALPKVDDGSLLSHARLVLATPLHFLKLVSLGALANLERYYREWVGVYGHWLGAVPAAIYWLFPLALLAALLSDVRTAVYPAGAAQTRSLAPAPRVGVGRPEGQVGMSARIRWLTLGVFLVSAGGTILIMYMLYYHGIDEPIGGVQGRYFLPLAPLLLLPLSGLAPLGAGAARAARWVALSLGLITLALYTLGLGATYYTNCGASLYTGSSCQQPMYKNLDKSGAPEIAVKSDLSIQQTFKNTCGPMESISMLVKNVAPDPQVILHFELLTENSQPIAEIKIPTAEIKPMTYVSLRVSPAAGEKGKIYRIRLASNTSATQDGITIATSHNREYFEGKLIVNGQIQNADLIFRYFCINPYQ